MKLADLIVMVAEAFGLSVAEVRTATKRRNIVAARAAYGELARRYTARSSEEIAAPIHSMGQTVSCGWRRFDRYLREARFAKTFAALDAALAAKLPRAPERVKTRKKPWMKGKAKGRPRLGPAPVPPDLAHEAGSIISTFHNQRREIERMEKAYHNGF
ncbi:hypothetical protein CCR94_16475 [Rhodoblastus sphagnicola]|uniref:Chromosomal replication initiator DnaA C-terminal domain-containing protein n=1 Tax=Rhodoblastus sphagnicola TaxID=333368 RepID=A0A2S6N2Y2_9HYPH|nr:hypothetical protein [Rhodoblastus sphagnicola]MBB4199093.1 hypothetical protein [Rhodoblastus sphagnicola]PPQ28985.1 hypothetical protein CCR94_16475 [Rhodoblastus sphagnicola]